GRDDLRGRTDVYGARSGSGNRRRTGSGDRRVSGRSRWRAGRGRLSADGRHCTGRSMDGHPGDRADAALYSDDLRADGGDAGRTVPGKDPLHVNVAPLPYRQWLVWRSAADRGFHDRGGDGRYLRRYLVSGHYRRHHLRGRLLLPARDIQAGDTSLNRRGAGHLLRRLAFAGCLWMPGYEIRWSRAIMQIRELEMPRQVRTVTVQRQQ